MQRSDVLVEVRNRDLDRIGTITKKYLDLSASLRWSNVGEWTITLPSGHPMVNELIQEGSGIVVSTRIADTPAVPPTYGPGATTRRNRVGNPDTVTGGTAFATSGGAGTYTPAGVVAGGVARRNLVQDPRITGTTRWVATNTVMSVVSGYMRSTATSAGPAAINPHLTSGSAASAAGSAAANDPFAMQVKIKRTGVDQYVRPRIGYADSTGVEIGSLSMSPVVQTVPAGSGDYTLTFVGVLPNTATISRLTAAVYFYSSVAAANPVGGQINEFRELVVDVGSVAPLVTGDVAYFDGATTDGTTVGGYQYDWAGTADASVSTKTLLVAGGMWRLTATGGASTYTYPIPVTSEALVSRYTVTSGDKYAFRVKVTNPNASTIYVRLSSHWYVAAGTGALPNADYGALVALASGATATLEIMGVVPTASSGGAIASSLPILWLYSTSGAVNPTAGQLVDSTEWAFYTGTTAPTTSPVPYVSGSIADVPGLGGSYYDWEAATNASPSTLKPAVMTDPGSPPRPQFDTRFSGPTIVPARKRDARNPNGTYTFSGVTDEQHLADARAFPSPAVSNPAAQTAANDVRSGPVETLMHQYVAA